MSSQVNQHIATEFTSIDNKTKKNASDILALENKLNTIHHIKVLVTILK